MAGHSHWANIAAKKGVVDKKRGKLFGKLSRAIIVAAQTRRRPRDEPGASGTPSTRPARISMPNDNIDRAIKKGTGESGDASQFNEVIYEGYGPDGVAVMCEILTDNRNRTAGEIRKIFEIHGGNLGSTNCVAWMFERKGLFLVPAANVTEERLFEVALEAGADDVKRSGDNFEVTCTPDVFSAGSRDLRGKENPHRPRGNLPHPREHRGTRRRIRPQGIEAHGSLGRP